MDNVIAAESNRAEPVEAERAGWGHRFEPCVRDSVEHILDPRRVGSRRDLFDLPCGSYRLVNEQTQVIPRVPTAGGADR